MALVVSTESILFHMGVGGGTPLPAPPIANGGSTSMIPRFNKPSLFEPYDLLT